MLGSEENQKERKRSLSSFVRKYLSELSLYCHISESVKEQ